MSFPLNSNSYPQMKHKFYNDGNIAGLLVLSGRGLYTQLPLSKKVVFTLTDNSPTAHLTPVPFIHTRPEYIYNVPDRHKPAGE